MTVDIYLTVRESAPHIWKTLSGNETWIDGNGVTIHIDNERMQEIVDHAARNGIVPTGYVKAGEVRLDPTGTLVDLEA